MVSLLDELKSILFDDPSVVNPKSTIFQRVSLIVREKRTNNQSKKDLEKIVARFQIMMYLFASMNESKS